MRGRFLMPVLVILAASLPWRHGQAAQIEYVNSVEVPTGDGSHNCNMRLTGEITPGDTSRLEKVARQISFNRGGGGAGSYFGEIQLCLNSPGGSYYEGLRIAEFLLTNHIPTQVEPNSNCFSACSIIFMAGGYEFEGMHIPQRHLSINGRLGFHAPYLKGVNERNYSASDIEGAYRQSIKAIRDLMRLGRNHRVASNFLSKALIGEMLDKGPNELFLVDTVYKAIRLNIQIYGEHIPNVSVAGLCNACMNQLQDRGIDASLDDAPKACSNDVPISRKGNYFWFGGMGSEGAFYCAARAPGVYGSKYSISGRLQSDKRLPRKNEWLIPPVYYLYPGNAPLRALQ